MSDEKEKASPGMETQGSDSCETAKGFTFEKSRESQEPPQ